MINYSKLFKEDVTNFKLKYMEEDKYYTPNVEELYCGYICQRLSENIWEDYICGNWHCAHDQDKDPLATSCVTLQYHNNKPWVRTKFLDKSDIESLGWINFHEGNRWSINQPILFICEKDNMMMSFDPKEYIIGISVKDPCKNLKGDKEVYDYPPSVGMFRGYCKSINELKIIMRFLKIN